MQQQSRRHGRQFVLEEVLVSRYFFSIWRAVHSFIFEQLILKSLVLTCISPNFRFYNEKYVLGVDM